MTKPAARIPDAVLADIRARLPIESVVGRKVRLAGAGSGWRKGLCPFHAETNPSFTVKPGQGTFHCFGCGAHGDVIGFLMRAEGLSFPEAAQICAAEAGIPLELAKPVAPAAPWVPRPAPAPAALPPGEHELTDEERTANAARLWDGGTGIGAASPQALYLAGRGLWPLPAPCHAVLRAASLPYSETRRERHPVLLARIDGPDGRLRAVHRTFLGQVRGQWSKLGGHGDPRKSYGPLKGNAIRLFPAAARLGVAEGIETALAAHRLFHVPVWSCLNASMLAAVELPFDVAELVVFADRDAPRFRGHDGWRQEDRPEGSGIHFARLLADRQRALAVKVEIRAPRERGDYADLWDRQRQPAGAGAA